jgi:hypothetical protein
VVAASLLKGRGWLLAVVVSGAAMALLAMLGAERQKMLQQHQASGTMRELTAEQIVVLRVAAGERQWRLVRSAPGWACEPTVAAAGADLDARVDAALRLLRNAAPEREFESDSPEFGLSPPALLVRVYTAADATMPAAFEIAFGGANPIGMARYARVTYGGQRQTLLLPAYVAEAWETLLASR